MFCRRGSRSEYLSVERLLVGAMQQRGVQQLKDLERELRLLTPGAPQVRGVPSALHAPLLYPPLNHEGLTVMADMQTGKLLVTLGVYQGETVGFYPTLKCRSI